MFASPEEQSFHPSFKHDPLSEADDLLAKISAFWDEITTAQVDRVVVLTQREQERLYEEILRACELQAGSIRTQ